METAPSCARPSMRPSPTTRGGSSTGAPVPFARTRGWLRSFHLQAVVALCDSCRPDLLSHPRTYQVAEGERRSHAHDAAPARPGGARRTIAPKTWPSTTVPGTLSASMNSVSWSTVPVPHDHVGDHVRQGDGAFDRRKHVARRPGHVVVPSATKSSHLVIDSKHLLVLDHVVVAKAARRHVLAGRRGLLGDVSDFPGRHDGRPGESGGRTCRCPAANLTCAGDVQCHDGRYRDPPGDVSCIFQTRVSGAVTPPSPAWHTRTWLLCERVVVANRHCRTESAQQQPAVRARVNPARSSRRPQLVGEQRHATIPTGSG